MIIWIFFNHGLLLMCQLLDGINLLWSGVHMASWQRRSCWGSSWTFGRCQLRELESVQPSHARLRQWWPHHPRMGTKQESWSEAHQWGPQQRGSSSSAVQRTLQMNDLLPKTSRLSVTSSSLGPLILYILLTPCNGTIVLVHSVTFN